MILGFILLRRGGVPVLVEELVPILTREGRDFLPSIISALHDMLTKVVGERVRWIGLEETQLYLRPGGDYMLALISDVRSERVELVAEDMIRYLEGLGVGPGIAEGKVRDEVRRALVDIIRRHPPSLAFVRELARRFPEDGFRGQGMEVGAEYPRPEVLRPGIVDRLRVLVPRGVSVDRLVDLYLEGRFEDVVRRAPACFGTGDDLARALYAKASLMLRSLDPGVGAPELDEVASVVEGIGDPPLREYLRAELRCFYELGTYNERRRVFLENRRYFLESLAEEGVRGDVLSLVLTPIPCGPALDHLIDRLRGRSEYLEALLYASRLLLNLLTRRPESPEEVEEVAAWVRGRMQGVEARPAKYVYAHMLFFVHSWALLCGNVGAGEGRGLLKRLLEFVERWFDELYEAKRLPNRYKGVIFYFVMNVILRLALLGALEVDEEVLNRYALRALMLLRWVRGLGAANRIEVDMYYVTLSGLLAAASLLFAEMGSYVRGAPRIVADLARDEMEGFWELNEYHYGHYYVDLLETLGNTALALEDGNLRTMILLRAAYGIERVAWMFRGAPMNFWLFMTQAVRFYLLSGEDRGLAKAEDLRARLRSEASPFVSWLIDRMFERYTG